MAAARRAWWTEADGGVGGISPERLVFLDECGVLTTMARLHGRSPRGTRARASAPFGHWTRVTVLGALGHEGIVGAMGVEAATGAAVFHAYLEGVLLPELRRAKPDAVLVMDTCPPTRPRGSGRCSTAQGSLTATCPPTPRTSVRSNPLGPR